MLNIYAIYIAYIYRCSICLAYVIISIKWPE